MERAGGREVCFLVELTPERELVRPRAVARGNHHAVLAAARDAKAGEVIVHNHPSGILEPSDADLALAARVYEAGLGTAITDNRGEELYVVVEPPEPRIRETLALDDLDAILRPGGELSELHPGFEDRPSQRTMARQVGTRFNEGGVLVAEAGTGTGKSLAYLLPAALWALRNGERTVVSTNTINLQEQLAGKDLPLVRRLVGEKLSWALVKGRGNYVSIRRLLLASESAPTLFEDDRSEELQSLREWAESTADGSLADLAAAPSAEVWDEVRSDGDICLGARCSFFQQCFYQRSRRTASSADVLVANHALLFADLALRRQTDNWGAPAVLPPYRHVVLDEAHNVEDAATSHLGAEASRTGLFRLLARLDRNGKGVLAAIESDLRAESPADGGSAVLDRIRDHLRPGVSRAREALTGFFDALEPRVPGPGDDPLRLGRGDPRDPTRDPAMVERLDRLLAAFGRLGREVEELRVRIEMVEERRHRMEGRLLDLRAVERRLEHSRTALSLVLDPGDEGDRFVRWIEGRGRPGEPLRNVTMAAAPVEPGPLLRASLFEQVDTAILTSATLSVGDGDFRFMRGRLGLTDAPAPDDAQSSLVDTFSDGSPIPGIFAGESRGGADGVGSADAASAGADFEVVEALLESPFDYRSQTLLGVPTDLPEQRDWRPFQEATARVVGDLVTLTDGGVFVLFTSYRALDTAAAHLRAAGLDRRYPLLVHGEAPRSRLLADFTRSGRGVLLGTSSFWEGVDVPGDPLRALVLQKIPFRVPTEPITQARSEAIERRGGNGFMGYQVPLAALRLKQGFGRLIRSRADRGTVLILDRRILTARYGRRLRAALPDAPLVKGPWEEVRGRLRSFYETPSTPPDPRAGARDDSAPGCPPTPGE
ncbi:MAG: hypothetical protein EA351_05210 [Gemmatimonadales bacterium]|nr:MAG: hypothetical protein EA351_05210 [Gemmatimonadales bacterium]